MKHWLFSYFLFSSPMCFAEVVPHDVKTSYAQSTLAQVLGERGFALDRDSVDVSVSWNPAQIALQTGDLIANALPLGNVDLDFDVVEFQALDKQGNTYEGWINLFSVTGNGCQNQCSHQLDYPTATKAVNPNGEVVYLRLYNFSLPKTTAEMDLHLEE